MTKRAQIITAVVLVILIVLAILFGVARSRNAITFKGWRPQFNTAVFTNPRPSLDHKVTFPADFPENAKEIFNTNLAATKAKIEADPSNVGTWFDLAIAYRMVGDYDEAAKIWKYVSATNPTEGISLHNLGEYYFHTKKDYKTAEDYYLRSVVVAPKLEANYSDLHEMYANVYKTDTPAAVQILEKGVVEVNGPGSLNLETMLGQYYETKGNKADAKAAYTEARRMAVVLNNKAAVKELDQRIERLK